MGRNNGMKFYKTNLTTGRRGPTLADFSHNSKEFYAPKYKGQTDRKRKSKNEAVC